MAKQELRFKNLRAAMEAIQSERSMEVGGHTWQSMVERYGEAVLFAEIASITGRLESLIWNQSWQYGNASENIDRILDLCIDLGNYAEFLYLATLDREEREQFLRQRNSLKDAGVEL